MRCGAVLLCLVLALVGCQKPPPDYVSRYTEPPAEPVAGIPVAIVGDSYTSGTAVGGSGTRGWPSRVEVQLRDQGIDIYPRIAAQGGAGYVNRGRTGLVFSDELDDVVTNDVRLIVIFGSINDASAPPNELTDAVHRTLAAAKASAPRAKLVVIGPPWLVTTYVPEILRVRDIVRTQAEAVGATFADPIAENWLSPEVIGSDGAQPTDAGHDLLTSRIAPLIAGHLR